VGVGVAHGLFCGQADKTETSMAGQTKSSVARRDGLMETGE